MSEVVVQKPVNKDESATWPMVALGDVTTINPRLPRDSDETQTVSFVSMASASEEGFLLDEEPRILSETKKGFTYFAKDDVLVAKITPCFENGKCLRPNMISNQIGFGSTEFHVLRADEDRIDEAYLFYAVWNDKFRYLGDVSMSGAAGQKRISSDFLKQYQIPLPPLPEQKRIAAILDKADSIRRKRQQATALADEFLRSVFLDMFGDPVTNPNGWNVKSLGEIFKLSSGKGLSAKNMDPAGSYPVYGGNGVSGYHSEYMFEEPQLVIGRVGVYCGSVHVTEEKAWVTDNALYVKSYKEEVNVDYLAQLLDLANLNQYAGRVAQPLISGNRIYPIELMFPPIEDQSKFASIKKSVKARRVQNEETDKISSELFLSLSQAAFSGRL